ncbi:hypothetical protein J5N97_024178 [Dioscorea zingiberensis]|uniref:Uncharacterized protein n=1 Tax=Dioscorea zingiberensis TaxID=325984 RepID=A0A9D5H8I9_9LILI|nr:hypothetical protein J5N97_024178 [Dioscorea zingiberensis]
MATSAAAETLLQATLCATVVAEVLWVGAGRGRSLGQGLSALGQVARSWARKGQGRLGAAGLGQALRRCWDRGYKAGSRRAMEGGSQQLGSNNLLFYDGSSNSSVASTQQLSFLYTHNGSSGSPIIFSSFSS